MKKTFLALLLAFSPALWVGTPAYAHPLSPAECEGLRNYVRVHALSVSSWQQHTSSVCAARKEKKSTKRHLESRHLI